MTEVLMLATLLLPMITAVTELVKRTVSIPKNTVPAIALGVGVLIGLAAYPFTDLELVLRLWAGGLAGLSSTGLYELALNNRPGNTKE
ncbi:holin [Sporolactobacillus nakayamae]|uniref:Bacteriophage A118-like holin, Hol118 n=1 Tax=Sporolactobacillus nakayamae TaxID=269670 RepID=A0A1I2UFJ0_9BACL|nr:holin [Sporolactobacillus nakayamae]SFG73491.1 Bacteriophage A118-like holin, Hol118 [Sporolactobacillus nakayamae]